MVRKKWYRKKRFYVFIVFVLYLFAIQAEWAKNRYDPTSLVDHIFRNTQLPAELNTIKKDGKTITFLKVGNNKKLPILILVHGSPGSLVAYDDYYSDPELLSKFNIISVDRLGFGYSQFGYSEPDLDMQSELIVNILKDYPNQKKILVGHSLGGAVVSKIAMDYPDLVDGLVLVAASISPALEPSNKWRKILNLFPFRILTPAALRVCNQEIIPLKTELEKMMPFWSNIVAPVIIIHGEIDSLVPYGNADFAKEMLVNSPHVKVEKIKNGNHFILWSEVSFIKNEINALLYQLD